MCGSVSLFLASVPFVLSDSVSVINQRNLHPSYILSRQCSEGFFKSGGGKERDHTTLFCLFFFFFYLKKRKEGAPTRECKKVFFFY